MPHSSPLVAIGRSSTFRLTLLYFLLFAFSVLALFGVTYWQTVVLLDRQSAARLTDEIDDLANIYRTGGGTELVRAIVERSDASRGTSTVYLLVDASGRLLAGNLDAWPKATSSEEGWLRFRIRDRLAAGRPATQNAPAGVETATAEAKTFELPGGVRLLVGRNLADLQAYRRRFESAATLIALLTLVLGLGGGLLLTRRVLARLDTINAISDRILAGELDRRIPVGGRGDEFDRLAANLNATLDEIERLLAGMRQVTDNIAHDLRTPLGRLRNRLELALLQPREADRDRALLEGGIGEIDDLLGTFNALLLIAQLEAGHRESRFVAVDLAGLAYEAVELYAPAAEERGQSLDIAAPLPAFVRGEPHLLAQLLANLLDNATKFGGSDGSSPPSAPQTIPSRPQAITVSVSSGAGTVRLEVADRGPGITPEDRERVLGRLVRLDNSRGKPGSGLGLSLAKAIAELHQGHLRLEGNDPGLKVIITFPAAAPDTKRLPSS